MRTKPMQLSTRGLIAAAIAGTASGYAVAEQAGRVNFVTGDVKATSTDGSVRSLVRGDVINTGDKISTGSGRLQLRFTDGGFVSLQPNTVFGVDQYLYANKPPEETSLFFSLLQGGMRTITGAIGKVNKQSYKVRTPVATIGIRGTEYLARVDPKRVLVSVGSGFVNVSNESGNITGGAGQNIEAREGLGPRLTDDQPDVTASGPEGEDRYFADDTEENRQQRMGDQINLDKNNLVLANGSPPVYTYVEQPDPLPNGGGYSLQTTNPVTGQPTTISGLTATFDPNTGAITSLVQTGPTLPLSGQSLGAAAVPTGPTFKPGTLKFVNIARYGAIGWGEITDGIAETNDFDELPDSVGANEFYGYMIATPSVGFTGGKASYSLKGASAARLNRSSNSGTLDHFNFDLNLLSGLASVDMLVKMTDSSIGNVSVTGQDVALNRGPISFSLSSLTTTSTGSFCSGSGGCSSSITGMFVSDGAQVAASYGISGSSGKITGYAALGLNQYLPQQDDFAVATPFDSYGYASVVQNGNGSLASFSADTCNDGCYSVFESGTLKFANVGHSGSIYWGEYTDGIGRFTGDENYTLELGANEFAAYLIGPQVIPSFSGKATYSLRGGTPARLNEGATTATLSHFNLALDLGFGRADVDLLVKLGSQDISAQGTNLNLGGYNSTFYINNITTTSTGSFCGSGSCYTNINGFFSGNDGDQLGVGYNINGNGGEISGVAALGRDSLAPAAESGYSLLTAYSGEGSINAGTLDAAFNADNSINYLVEPSACEGDCVFQPGTLKTVSVGHSTYLRWGEYTNGTALYGDINGLPGTLAGGQYASYIIGKTTSVTAINAAATASYSLRGGTPARVMEGSGAATSATLDLFKIDLNLFSGLVNIDMGLSGVGTANEEVTVTGRNISLPLLGMGSNQSGNVVDTYPGVFQITNGLTTTSSANVFCGEGCNTYINGMFAGDASEIGAAYFINGTGSISGVAALGLDSKTSGNTNALKTGDGYILLADRGSNVVFTNGNPYNTSATNEATFDTAGNLQSFATIYAGEGDSTPLDAGSATRASGSETGTYKTLHWGRLTGTGQEVTYNNETGPLGDVAAPENIHYVVGTITDPYSWQALNQGYAGGTATYSVVGKTNPTDTNGNVGTLNSASLTLHLDYYQPRVDLALNVTMGSNTYDASSTNTYLNYLGCGPTAATFNVSNMTTTVNGGSCGGSGCNTSVHGFFSGSQAQQAGMSYSIQDTGTANTTITGAAALTATSLSVPAGGSGNGI